jgi:phosphatidylinositol alpha-1,6-mannosyltransferase
MRILILSIEFPPGPGGLGMYSYQTASHLSRLGCQILVATPQAHVTEDETKNFNETQPFLIKTFRFRGLFLREAIERLLITLYLIRKYKPQLILTFGKQAAWLGAIASQLSSVRLILTGAGTEFLEDHPVRKKLNKWAYRKARRIVFISLFTQTLAKNRGYSIKNSVVIPLGADEHLYRPNLPVDDLRNKLNLQGKQIILTVGNISERKAQDIVIRSLPEVVTEIPQVVYLIAGLPTLQTYMETLANELGVVNHVKFLGKIPQAELPYLYNLADVFILVSRQSIQGEVEGFGIVVMEASLCGVPSIVAENTGLVEAILPGQTGLVVPQESPSETAKALVHLLSNDNLRQIMGENARNWALQNSTWEKRISELFTLLQEELNSN